MWVDVEAGLTLPPTEFTVIFPGFIQSISFSVIVHLGVFPMDTNLVLGLLLVERDLYRIDDIL